MDNLIDSVAEAIMLADCADLRALAELHRLFMQWSREQSSGEESLTAKLCADLVEKIILAETPDPALALQTVADTVAVLQSARRDGQPFRASSSPRRLFEWTGAKLPDAQPVQAAMQGLGDGAEAAAIRLSTLEELEALALRLEKEAGAAAMPELLRLLHTLKGDAGFLGQDDIVRMCHFLEETIAAKPAKPPIDLLLGAKDWMQRHSASLTGSGAAPEPIDEWLRSAAKGSKSRRKRSRSVTAPTEARAIAAQPPTVAVEPPAAVAHSPDDNEAPADPALIAEFVAEALEHLETVDAKLLIVEDAPDDEEAINTVFRAFHTIKGVSSFLNFADIRELAHEAESLLDRIRSRQLRFNNAVLDVLLRAVELLKTLVRRAGAEGLSGGHVARHPDVPAVVRRIQNVMDGAAPANEIEDTPTIGVVEEAPPERNGASPTSTADKVAVRDVVRVDAQRLDRMVEAIGELVIAASMVRQAFPAEAREQDRRLLHLDKITRDLQEMGTSLRMVPLRSTFQKMTRLARDLARKLDKPIEFVTSGEDAEMDKTVVDQIGDPLLHMVRNAVDHGIEKNAADRERAGKSKTGRVELRAFHKGGGIRIEIADDGRGLDKNAILDKAAERGLLAAGVELSERETFGLIFEPGFSTAQTVTDVSGRGVGMDVVKRSIQALRGQIEIESTPGKGTTFSIRLPLTLAVIDGMTLRVGSERYILPTQTIIRSLRPKPGQLSRVVDRGELLNDHGRLIPLLRLCRLFDIEGAEDDPTRAIVVVVGVDGVETGVLVDELLGQQQIVIKSLGEAMSNTPGVSGGAILADGRVGLIVDAEAMIRLARQPGNSKAATVAANLATMGVEA